MKNGQNKIFIFGILLCLLLTIFLSKVTLLTPNFERFYSSTVSFRYQTDAFLSKQIQLLLPIEKIDFGFVYYEGKMQLAWGLGISALRLPFEIFTTDNSFPDRLVLIFYLFLSLTIFFVAVYKHIERTGSYNKATYLIAASSITVGLALFSPLVNMLLTDFSAFDEAAFYSQLFALVLFSLTLLLHKQDRSLFLPLILSVLCGISVGFRPTSLAYAAATMVVVIIHTWYKRKQLLLCVLIFITGLLSIGYTNHLRFGSVLEFGHSLNISSDIFDIYSLKFESPYKQASLTEANVELVQAIFFQKSKIAQKIDQLLTGTEDTQRWRQYYYNTFNGYYFLFFVLFISAGTIACLPRNMRKKVFEKLFRTDKKFDRDVFETLFLWPAVSFALLYGFYLYSPSLSSRYVSDFTISIFAMIYLSIHIVKSLCSNISKENRGYIFILFIYFIFIFSTYFSLVEIRDTKKNVRLYNKEMLSTRLNRPVENYVAIGNSYSIGEVFGAYGIPFNGIGWNENTGIFRSAIQMFTKNTGMLDLQFKGSCDNLTKTPQVRIGNDIVDGSLTADTENAHISFEIPSRYNTETVWPVFIRLLPIERIGGDSKECRLTKISW